MGLEESAVLKGGTGGKKTREKELFRIFGKVEREKLNSPLRGQLLKH
jgi:hypothetical protein